MFFVIFVGLNKRETRKKDPKGRYFFRNDQSASVQEIFRTLLKKMREQMVYGFSNHHWKYVFSNIMIDFKRRMIYMCWRRSTKSSEKSCLIQVMST